MGTLALPHGAFPRFKKEFPMRKHIVLAAATAAALFISGCANMSDTQRRTATGAGVGAAAGAVLGAVTGGRAGTGAVIGAGVGALGTYIWSQNMEKQKREMEQATQGTGVNVSQTADNQLKLDIPSDISFDTDRKSTRLNSSHANISYAVFCLTNKTIRRQAISESSL